MPFAGRILDQEIEDKINFILKVEGKKNAYIAMFDINKPEHPFDSGYIWLPVELDGSKMSIPWKDQWSPISHSF